MQTLAGIIIVALCIGCVIAMTRGQEVKELKKEVEMRDRGYHRNSQGMWQKDEEVNR